MLATPISEQLITIWLKGLPANITLVQVYAPDSSRDDEESETFHLQLKFLANYPPKKDVLFGIDDFKAIAGKDHTCHEDVMGELGHGQLNKRGEPQIEFCRDSTFVITNPF